MIGGVEWQIQYEAKLSAVFATRSYPSAVFYRTTRVYGAFTDLLVLCGRINKTWNKSFNTYGYIEGG